MTTNIFQFGDINWLQARGTAMGTSAAVNYANVYVAVFKKDTILPEFNTSLLYYRWYIDNTFGIWYNPTNNINKWN